MNKVHTPKPRPKTAPDFPRHLARIIWPFTATLMGLMHFLFWRPGPNITGDVDALPFVLAIVAIAVLGYGLAAIAALGWTSRFRLRTVLWPTIGKLIGAFALISVTPIAVFGGIPFVIGSMFFFISLEIDGPGSIAFLIPIVGTLVWYPFSALIICGTRSKRLRIGLFCLMFWSCYAAHLL